jgi:hypothetical protein
MAHIQRGGLNAWRCIVQFPDWLTVIHITDVIAQYLKENIAGAPPTFMKVKMAFVALVIHM